MLDLGAGTGFMSRWLKRKTGVEPTLADVVSYNNRDRSMPYVELEDPLHVPVEADSFDVVLVMFVFHHMERLADQAALLDEAVRVARHRVIIVEDTPTSRIDRGFNVAWDWILNLRHGVPTPFTFRSASEWLDLFKERDLGIEHVETYRPLWPTLGTYHHSLFVLDR